MAVVVGMEGEDMAEVMVVVSVEAAIMVALLVVMAGGMVVDIMAMAQDTVMAMVWVILTIMVILTIITLRPTLRLYLLILKPIFSKRLYSKLCQCKFSHKRNQQFHHHRQHR